MQEENKNNGNGKGNGKGNTTDPNEHGNDDKGHNGNYGNQGKGNGQIKKQTTSHALWKLV